MNEMIYNKYSNERAPQFNIRTEIVEDEQGRRKVYKYPTQDESRQHIEQMYHFYQIFSEKYVDDMISVCPCKLENGGVCFEYITGKTLSDILLQKLTEEKEQDFMELFERYIRFLYAQSEEKVFFPNERFQAVFGKEYPESETIIRVHNPANIDLIFDNIIVNEQGWHVLDYEWTFNMEVPLDFIIYRSIFYLMYMSPFQRKLEKMNLYDKVGIFLEDRAIYKKMEMSFQKYVVGKPHEVKQYYRPGIDVKKLIAEKVWKEKEISFQIYEDWGKGFYETGSVEVPVWLENGEYFRLEYTIPQGVQALRVDPGNYSVILKVRKNLLQNLIETNGQWLSEELLVFEEEDPRMIFGDFTESQTVLKLEGKVGKINSVHAQMLSLYQERAKECKDAEWENAENQKQIIELQRQLNAIYASRSWKVVSALKKIAGIFRSNGQEVPEDSDRPEIAIHLHLFYTDLLEEFLEYFSNIPYPFDLYISCVKGADIQAIQEQSQNTISQLRKAVVKICENRGRDIAPFYVAFGRELVHYSYVLHVHSKKSKHIEEGGGEWRRYSLDSLVGSRELVEKIFEEFNSDRKIGLVYPECHPDIPMIGYTWMANAQGGKELLDSMGIPYHEGIFNYPAGSFFWARMDAIRPLFDRKFTNKDFPPEKGQIDGTLAHVLERAIAFVVEYMGYRSCIVDIYEKKIRYDKSEKPFRECLERSVQDIKTELEKYDSISFGVFDTLLSYDKEELLQQVKKHYGLDDTFIRLRKEAEHMVRQCRGDAMTIEDIYAQLVLISPFDENVAAQLKQTEINYLMGDIVLRQDMKEIYQSLIREGKRVSIVCDTYYRKETIEAILVKYGFIGYENIWVSSEYGYSKRNEHVWNLVYAEYIAQHHIHVGSDVYADWYTLEKRGAKSLWIMSREIEESFRTPVPLGNRPRML